MWPVVGHKLAVAWLTRSLEKGSLAHAYLVSGPAHVGKMTLALSLAQTLNCQATELPCGECSQCQRIAASAHPDVQIIKVLSAAESEDGRAKTEVSIEQIRDMQHWASLPPFEGKYRVFIIDEAEFLSLEAANCLLKTLEEPLERVCFILLTAEAGRLPETVISRCQRLDLKPLAAKKIEAALLSRGIEAEKARLLSRLCRGCPGWAIIAADDETLLQQRNERLTRLIDIISGDYEARFEYAAELATRFSQKRAEVQGVLGMWLDFWRDLLLIKVGSAEAITNLDFEDKLDLLAGSLSLADIRAFMAKLGLAQRQLRQNANARLVLEVLMLDMPRPEPGKASP